MIIGFLHKPVGKFYNGAIHYFALPLVDSGMHVGYRIMIRL